MKGVKLKAPEYPCTFMVKPDPDGFGYDIRFYNQIMGDMPILSLIHISEPTRPERIGYGGVCV